MPKVYLNVTVEKKWCTQNLNLIDSNSLSAQNLSTQNCLL